MSFKSLTFLTAEQPRQPQQPQQPTQLQKITVKGKKLRSVIIHRNRENLPIRLVIVNHGNNTKDPQLIAGSRVFPRRHDLADTSLRH